MSDAGRTVTVGAAGSTLPEHAELARYETHGKVYEQVTFFHGLLLNTINLYILATGAVWAFVLGSGAGEPGMPLLAAWIFSLFVSLAAFLICLGVGATIIQRLNLLQILGARYWPSIETDGQTASRMGLGWAVRRQVGIWCLIPVLGAVASTVLFLVANRPAGPLSPECARYLADIKTKGQPDLDRAIFLYRQAGCDRTSGTEGR